MANTTTLSDVPAWHATSQAEVVQRLATNPEKGVWTLEPCPAALRCGRDRSSSAEILRLL